MTTGVVILGVLLMFGLAMAVTEHWDWNKGVCRESGKPWVSFDADSGGAVGYTDNAGHYFWKSW